MQIDLNAPIFITGHWRSGTTLISRMLNNHKDICVTYDLVHFMRFSYKKYNPIKKESCTLQLVKDIAERIDYRYQIKLSVDEVMLDIGGSYSYAVIYNAIMSSLLLRNTTMSIWGEKTNLAWRQIPNFLEMFPNGRVINIIRDPRAVLSSFKKFTNAPKNDYLDSILNSYDAMKTAIKYKEILNDKRYITVLYEKLVNDPRVVMEEICQKLQIEFSENMLDQKMFKDRYGKSWRSNSIDKDPPEGIYKEALNKWIYELNDWEIFVCEKITSVFFKEFNYTESRKKLSINEMNRALIEIQKSKLCNEGLIRFLLTGKSVQRYPTDPLNKESWG